MLMGGKFLVSILHQSSEVERTQFINTLNDDIKTYSKYGSMKHISWHAPSGAEELCFVDATEFGEEKNGIYEGGSLSDEENPIIVDAVKSPDSPPKNAFLIDKDGTHPLSLLNWQKVALKPSFKGKALCLNVTAGDFRATINGKGRTALIEAR